MTIKRFFKDPKDSFFLFGPRGVGKSTFVKENYPNSLYINLLITNIFRTYCANPEILIKILKGKKNITTVIIDEIQKAPELLSIIHAIMEEPFGKNIQFILTGSSARKLKKEGVNLLAGRAIKKNLHPFMASEIKNQFSLENALLYGMLPLIFSKKNKREILQAYIDLYMVEEVHHEALVRNIGNFSRFLSVISFSHGNILNLNNIARECEVKRSSVQNYLNIIQDLLISYMVPIFTKKAKRALNSHSKFYLFDSGVFRFLRKLGPLDTEDLINGHALEGLVLQHLKAWADYSKGFYDIFYWRTKAGVEVDFIVYGENTFFAIEVKNRKKIFPKDLRGLLHFQKDYPECTPIFLYRGEEILKEKNILCIPCELFLKNLFPNKPIVSAF